MNNQTSNIETMNSDLDEIREKYIRDMTRGRTENASYQATEVSIYGGHPFIEALPQIEDVQKSVLQLERRPPDNSVIRSASPEVRIHNLLGLKQFFKALPRHERVVRNISLGLRGGYVGRNPLDPAYFQDFENIDAQMRPSNWPPTASLSGLSFAFIGPSGNGKTKTLEYALLHYPQIIYHRTYNGRVFPFTQVVWLKLDCPHDGSIKGLCLAIILAFDEILGPKSNYVQTYRIGLARLSVESLILIIGRLCRLHGLGMLIIDEIQNLNTARPGGASWILKYLVRLENILGIPVVVVGTYGAIRLLTSEFRQARRSSGLGSVVWEPLDLNIPTGAKQSEWSFFLKHLWKLQYTIIETPLDDKLTETLADETQRIPDLAVKLYLLAQLRIISTKGSEAEPITSALLISVAKDSFTLVAPMLKALREKDPHALSKYEDITALDIDQLIAIERAAQQKANLQASLAAYDTQPENATEHSKPDNAVENAPSAAIPTPTILPDSMTVFVSNGKAVGKTAAESLNDAGLTRGSTEFTKER